MNKIQRAPYYGLTKVEVPSGDVILCAFCRFAEWKGSCGEGFYLCQHQFPEVSEEISERVAESGVDCWGFWPDVAPEVAADMVGIWLQGQQVDSATVPTLRKERA